MAKTIFIIAMTPLGWDFLIKLEKSIQRRTGGGGISPWMERVRPEQSIVNLEPLSKNELFNLLKERIDKKRLDYKKPKFDTFPFIHPEFFDKIYDYSNGVPRMSLRMCDLVLDSAMDKGISKIDAKFASEILEASGLAI